MAKTKIISVEDSKIRIIGDNILYCNGVITAYYILPLTNYSVASEQGIIFSINNITNLLTNLCSQKQNVTFTIQRFSKTIQKKDVISNLYSSIKLYAPDYEMPMEFTDRLTDNVQDFCMLGVGINEKELSNVEDISLKDTAKGIISNIANSLFGGVGPIDEERVLQSEKNIYSILSPRCVRASKELVFYNYISKLYPCYDISYDKLSFINENSFTDILGSVTQTLEDNFGYFIMHNEGVDFFDLEPQDTYGCILKIKTLPLKIDASNFPMDYPGMQLNIKSITKEKAALQLKRTRASDKYELEEALKAGAESEQLEKTAESIDIATHAIEELDEGIQMCEFTATILITGITKEDLRHNITTIISDLKDRDILPAKSLSQALDYINGYVKLYHTKYDHFSALAYPLSFQLQSGSLVGNSDSKMFVPSIGEDIG